MSVALGQQYAAIIDRLLEDAGNRANRWTQLIELLDHVILDAFESMVARLETVDRSEWANEELESVGTALRDLAARHERFADAAWALPLEKARALARLAESFAPADPVVAIRWLFKAHVEIGAAGRDWDAAELRARQLRSEAASRLLHQGGLPLVENLASQVEAPWTVGVALAESDDTPAPVDVTLAALAWERVGRDVVRGFLMRLIEINGASVITEVLGGDRASSLSPDARGFIFSCGPFDAEMWERFEEEGPDVARSYWHNVPLYGRGELDQETVGTVAGALLGSRNASGAIRFLAMYRRQADPERILRTLEMIASPEMAGDVAWQALSLDLVGLVDALQDSDLDHDRLARLEWLLLPLLRFEPHRPRALEDKLARDPAFFVEVLSLAFRAPSEAPPASVSEERRVRAERALQLLSSWRRPPGSHEGGIEADELDRWVVEARRLAAEADRQVIGDEIIGQVLSGAPADAAEVWPAVAIRDVVEKVRSEDLERGLVIGVGNSRGVTTRGLGAGGGQERELAERYREWAEAVRDRWPRTGAVLMRIANSYERWAQREDVEAAIERRLAGWTEPSATDDGPQ